VVIVKCETDNENCNDVHNYKMFKIPKLYTYLYIKNIKICVKINVYIIRKQLIMINIDFIKKNKYIIF